MGKTYQEFGPSLVGDSIVVIKGRVSERDDGLNLHAVSLFVPDTGTSLGSGPLVISLPEHRATTEVVSALNDVVDAYLEECTTLELEVWMSRPVSTIGQTPWKRNPMSEPTIAAAIVARFGA